MDRPRIMAKAAHDAMVHKQHVQTKGELRSSCAFVCFDEYVTECV